MKKLPSYCSTKFSIPSLSKGVVSISLSELLERFGPSQGLKSSVCFPSWHWKAKADVRHSDLLRFFQTAKITKHLQHKFQAIPKGHERKSYKESEGSTKLGHERLKVVEKWLFFNQHVRGHVPQDKAEFSVGFLKKKNIYILWLNLCLLTTRVNGSSLNLYSK